MKATDILKDEHRVIERVLNCLEKAAERLEEGHAVDPQFFIDAADFAKGFADGCHHNKEEGVLFKAMAARGIAERGGPIGVMLDEHEEGRRLTRAIRSGAERLAAGEKDVTDDIVGHARDYVNLLRQHIQKEDNILFPMADQVIPPDDEADLTREFETVEREETGEGVHERYMALAEKLENQARAF